MISEMRKGVTCIDTKKTVPKIVWWIQGTRVNDTKNGTPNENDGNFPFQEKNNHQYFCHFASIVFRFKRT